jgi:hypothetical protein
VEINNGVGDVTDKTATSGDASGEGNVDVTPAGTDPVTYTITLTPERCLLLHHPRPSLDLCLFTRPVSA